MNWGDLLTWPVYLVVGLLWALACAGDIRRQSEAEGRPDMKWPIAATVVLGWPVMVLWGFVHTVLTRRRGR